MEGKGTDQVLEESVRENQKLIKWVRRLLDEIEQRLKELKKKDPAP